MLNFSNIPNPLGFVLSIRMEKTPDMTFRKGRPTASYFQRPVNIFVPVELVDTARIFYISV